MSDRPVRHLWSKNLPSGFAAPVLWDSMVIGSGMGGMTCAALLRRP